MPPIVSHLRRIESEIFLDSRRQADPFHAREDSKQRQQHDVVHAPSPHIQTAATLEQRGQFSEFCIQLLDQLRLRLNWWRFDRQLLFPIR